ncbi:MAG: hypothetical protein DPW18_05485 [Chloroflexi bacterium]|nr:hypothetical protein [Chloroflexota bacterium]
MGGALVLILEKWDEKKFTVVVTTDVISEYFEVLNRPKFNLKQLKTKLPIISISSPSLLFLKKRSDLSRTIPKTITLPKPRFWGKLISLLAENA